MSSRLLRARLTYRRAGVNIADTDEAKEAMKGIMASRDRRVLSHFGDYAALFDARFPGIRHPVLALKVEEPGSKQLLAFAHDRVEDVCRDMIHHLVNDIVVVGATPLAVLDVVICGGFDKRTMLRIIRSLVSTCRSQGCELVGGETSLQPGVLAPDRYVLSASIVGVVERRRIIGRASMRAGDILLALPSAGPHTNGYTLIRRLLEREPAAARRRVGRTTFLEAVLAPHIGYYPALRVPNARGWIHGLAHVTGGGIADNLVRILPPSLDAIVDLGTLRVPPVFQAIRKLGNVPESEMLRVFNNGVGMVAAVPALRVVRVSDHLRRLKVRAYPIGHVVRGRGVVRLQGRIPWPP